MVACLYRLQYQNNTITCEVTDVPAADSIRQGIKHAPGLIYNAKQEREWSTRLFKLLQTNVYRYT